MQRRGVIKRDGVLLFHPFGNANVRQLASALVESQLLSEYWTSVNIESDSFLGRILPKRLASEIRRRSMPAEVEPFVRLHPFPEALRLLAQRARLPALTGRDVSILSPLRSLESLDRRVARNVATSNGISAVYAYDHCARDSFLAARERGIRCIYELPTGYWRVLREMVSEERALNPDWSETVASADFSDQIYARRDEELELADTLVVPSQFVLRTLAAHPNAISKAHVIPYGAPTPLPTRRPGDLAPNHPLRVLYVGNLGLMKGIPYVLKAVEQFGKKIELTLIGARIGHCVPLERALERHLWIPSLPHAAVLEEMKRHDVLVFGSLFDGFGLVLLEALSRGLPVIATENSGAPDVISNGIDGFIVPIRSAEEIAARLAMLDKDRGLLAHMSAAAIRLARVRSWEAYRRRLIEIVRERE